MLEKEKSNNYGLYFIGLPSFEQMEQETTQPLPTRQLV